MTLLRALLVMTLALLFSCAAQNTQMASLDKGFGGTGVLPCPQTIAHTPGDSGFGGTGVIGTITDFGSIWVNGLEIELKPSTRIDSNLGYSVKLAIGQQVITHTAQNALETDQVTVFYPIAGRIGQRTDNTLTIQGQTVRMDANTQGLKNAATGDHVAISALPQPDGSWLATRIDPNPRHVEKIERPSLEMIATPRALLEGTVIHRGDQAYLMPYDLPLSASEARAVRNGQLALVVAQRIRDRWLTEQIQPLRHWRMDWHDMRQQHRTLREQVESSPHAPREMMPERTELLRDAHSAHEIGEAAREQAEQMREAQTSRDASEMAREQVEQMREAQTSRDASETAREQVEQMRETREQRDSLRQQQEDMQELKEMRDQFEARDDYHEVDD